MTNLLILFIVLSVLNVVLNTIKSIVTIKCGALPSAIINAVTFGVYTIVIIYTNCELALWLKVLVTALTNFIGVYVVKIIEAKFRKEKLWKVEATVERSKCSRLDHDLYEAKIPHNYVIAGRYVVFNCYCATQNESALTKKFLTNYGAKWFVSETKSL